MSDDTKAKLEKLAKIEHDNRSRSRKYLSNLKAQGKRQIAVILDDKTIDVLARLKDESISAGKPLKYGDIIEKAINNYVNSDANIYAVSDVVSNDISDDKTTIENTNTISNSDTNSDDTINVNIDKNSDTIPDWKTQKAEYKIYLENILKKLEHGNWKEQAEKLNNMSIVTAKGLPWKDNNLRMACNKFK